MSELLFEASALAEAWDLEHRGLVEAHNVERRVREESQARARDLETKLKIREAEHARFAGRDWPREVEALERRHAAALEKSGADLAAARARIAHLENAVRALTALGGINGAEPAERKAT